MEKRDTSIPFVTGKVREIPLAEAPPTGSSKYWKAYTDIRLRLEQTPPGFAIEFEIVSGSPPGATSSIARLFNDRLGEGAVKLWHGVRESDGQPCLYARRGPNYDKAPQATKNGKARAEVTDFD